MHILYTRTGCPKSILLGRDVLISFKSHAVEGCPDIPPALVQALGNAGWILAEPFCSLRRVAVKLVAVRVRH